MAGVSFLRAAAVGLAAAVVILVPTTIVLVNVGPTADDVIAESAQVHLPPPAPAARPLPVLPPTAFKDRTASLPDPSAAGPAAEIGSVTEGSTATDAVTADPMPAPPPGPDAVSKIRPKPKPTMVSRDLASEGNTKPGALSKTTRATGTGAPAVVRPGASETFGRDVRLHLEPGVTADRCDGGHYDLEWRMASLDDAGRERDSGSLKALPRRLRCRTNRPSLAELPADFFGAGAFEIRARHSWPEDRNRPAGQSGWTAWRSFQVLPP